MSRDRLHVIFLGPSLSREEAQVLHPEALILPPARVGDVVSVLLNYRPHAIGLVDGVFRNTMAVFHKELLEAMAQGVWVVGSSSMGALRAAECERFGMIGVGEVFELYRSGVLEDDDEVAVAHGDHESDYRALSNPMVTIRATLLQESARNLLSVEQAHLLIAAEKAKHFADRGFHGVIETAGVDLAFSGDQLKSLRDFIRSNTRDVKADDARALLAALQELPEEPVPIAKRPAGHVSSAFVTLMDRDRTVGVHDELPVTFDAIMRYVALNQSEHKGIRSNAARRQILLQLSRVLDLEPSPDDLMRAHSALATRLGIAITGLPEWAESVDLTRSDLDRLITEEATIDRLGRWVLQTRTRDGFVRAYLDELRLAGLYREMRKRAGQLEQLASTAPLVEGLGVRETLSEHTGRTGWKPPASWAQFIEEGDLGNESEVFERLTTYITARRAQPLEVHDVAPDSRTHPEGGEGLAEPRDRPMRSRGV